MVVRWTHEREVRAATGLGNLDATLESVNYKLATQGSEVRQLHELLCSDDCDKP